MGGGGSRPQSSTTTQSAEYPPEFRPLASSAVGQIQALQNLLPLAQFGATHPMQTAGISPFQQATLNQIPFTLSPTAGLQGLFGLQQPLGNLAQAALGYGGPTPAAQWALSRLGAPQFVGGPPPSITPQGIATPTNVLGAPTLPADLAALLAQSVPPTTPFLQALGV